MRHTMHHTQRGTDAQQRDLPHLRRTSADRARVGSLLPGVRPRRTLSGIIKNMRRTLAIFTALVVLSGCASASNDAPGVANELANSLDGARVVEVTADNDPQGIFTAEQPPASMAVIHLPGSDCVMEHAPCGAAVIVHTTDAAQVRKVAAYSQAMAIDSGSGYVYQVRDSIELIIDGRQSEIVKAQLVADFDGDSPLAK